MKERKEERIYLSIYPFFLVIYSFIHSFILQSDGDNDGNDDIDSDKENRPPSSIPSLMSLTPRRPSPTKTSSSSPTTTSVTTPSSMSDELRKRIIAFEEEQSRNEQQRQQLKGEAITPVQPIPQRYDVVGSERPEEEPLKVTIPSSVRKEYFFCLVFGSGFELTQTSSLAN